MNRRLRIEYGDGVFALPREGLMNVLPSANEFNLKVLLLAAAEDLRQSYDVFCSGLCLKLDCTQSALERAFAFWTKAGVLSIVDINSDSGKEKDSDKIKNAAPAEVKTLQSASAPEYTEGQCADIIAASNDLPDLISMSQQILGKIFTSADVRVIIMLYDHLGLSGDYIASLLAYCAENGKKSLRYIEKTALGLFDEGIDTSDALTAYIKRRENLEDNLSKIRKLIGAGSRELTDNEKKSFARWLGEWHFEMDVITRAYEIMVDKINKPSVSYMNRILENWHKSGLATLAAVEASLEAYKKNKAEASHDSGTVNGAESGFRTDEFFEAALKRSYKEKES